MKAIRKAVVLLGAVAALTSCARNSTKEEVLRIVGAYFSAAVYEGGIVTCEKVNVSAPTEAGKAYTEGILSSQGYQEGKYTKIPSNEVYSYRLTQSRVEALSLAPTTQFKVDGRYVIIISKSVLFGHSVIGEETFDDNGYQIYAKLNGTSLSDPTITFYAELSFSWDK